MQSVRGTGPQESGSPPDPRAQAPARATGKVKGPKVPKSPRGASAGRNFHRSGSKYSPEERRERDARMQHRLNLMRIHRVAKAARESGWFTMPLSDFEQVPVEDYGDRMEISYEDGSRYVVSDFKDDVVTLRRIASRHGSPSSAAP